MASSNRVGRISRPLNDYAHSFRKSVHAVKGAFMTVDEARRQLERIPMLAVMTNQEEQSQKLSSNMPDGFFCDKAELQYLGELCFLCILGHRKSEPSDILGGGPLTPGNNGGPTTLGRESLEEVQRRRSFYRDAIVHLVDLEQQVYKTLGHSSRESFHKGLWIWPFHDSSVRQAMLGLPLLLAKQNVAATDFEGKARIMHILGQIGLYSWPWTVFEAINGQFGEQTAFTFALDQFYAQALWVLALACTIYLFGAGFLGQPSVVQSVSNTTNSTDSAAGSLTCTSSTPASLEALVHAGNIEDADRIPLVIMMVVMFVWAALVAFFARRRLKKQIKEHKLHHQKTRQNLMSHEADSDEGDEHLAPPRQPSTRKSMVQLFFLWLPLVVVFSVVVFTVNMLVCVLLIYVVYDWGDCSNPCLNPPYTQQVCRDPSVKHGFLGWAVELLCDLLLVVAFEAFLPIGHFFAEWMADLCNKEKGTSERAVMIETLDVLFAAIESLGFRACMAFIFVPQWQPPMDERGTDFETLFICDMIMIKTWCRLQVSNVIRHDRRLNIFEKMMKGPFAVAPFVSILMKVFVPCVANSLCRFAESHFERNPAMCLLRGLSRLLGLIFAYDGGHVGGFRFLSHGWPFEDLKEVSGEEQSSAEEATTIERTATAAGRERNKHKEALRQFALKEFENSNEVLEVKLSFLNVLFFGPVMPLGVIFTLFAKVVQLRSDLVKLLITRRRALPSNDTALRTSFERFAIGATISSVSWYMGLILTTYKEDAYTWWPHSTTIPIAAVTVAILGLFSADIATELRKRWHKEQADLIRV